jgi:hypothetical protein
MAVRTKETPKVNMHAASTSNAQNSLKKTPPATTPYTAIAACTQMPARNSQMKARCWGWVGGRREWVVGWVQTGMLPDTSG